MGAALTVVRSPEVARGLAYMPGLMRNWLEKRWLERLEEASGHCIDAIWLFENSRFFDMRFAGSRLCIYQQVDLNQDFNPKIAAATADLAIAISEPIEKRIKPSAQHYLRLTHGVATGHESSIPDASLDEQFSPGMRHAVLVGNLDIPYLDLKLLEHLVRDHPEVRFHFVGSYNESGDLFRAVGHADNVVWWGRQKSEALPSILRRADLLLVTYLTDRHREQLANPHKLMEYLASGTPILASFTEEYDDRPELVAMAENAAEFRRKFSRLIFNDQMLSDPGGIKKRQDYAADNTYSRQLDRIAQALGPRGKLIS